MDALTRNFLPQARVETLLAKAIYTTFKEAITAATAEEGGRVVESFSLVCNLDEAKLLKQYAKKYGKRKLLEVMLCHVAEAK